MNNLRYSSMYVLMSTFQFGISISISLYMIFFKLRELVLAFGVNKNTLERKLLDAVLLGMTLYMFTNMFNFT